MAANSSAVWPGVMRSKQPHSLRIGICWATRWRTSLRWSTHISMLPTGIVWATVRMFWRMSGSTARTVEYRRPDGEVGQVEDDGRDHVDHRRDVGQDRGEQRRAGCPLRSFHAGVLTPSR